MPKSILKPVPWSDISVSITKTPGGLARLSFSIDASFFSEDSAVETAREIAAWLKSGGFTRFDELERQGVLQTDRTIERICNQRPLRHLLKRVG